VHSLPRHHQRHIQHVIDVALTQWFDRLAAHAYLVAWLPRARQRPDALHDRGDVRRRARALEQAQEPVLGRGGVQHQLAARQEQRGPECLLWTLCACRATRGSSEQNRRKP